MKTKTMLSSSSNIAKDSLNESPVHITRSVHMETYVLNGVADVRPCQRQVLQSAGNAAIERCIRSWCTIQSGDFGLGFCRCGGGLAIRHPSTLQNILSILFLRKKGTGGITPHIDAKEEMQCSEVLEGEFRAQP